MRASAPCARRSENQLGFPPYDRLGGGQGRRTGGQGGGAAPRGDRKASASPGKMGTRPPAPSRPRNRGIDALAQGIPGPPAGCREGREATGEPLTPVPTRLRCLVCGTGVFRNEMAADASNVERRRVAVRGMGSWDTNSARALGQECPRPLARTASAIDSCDDVQDIYARGCAEPAAESRALPGGRCSQSGRPHHGGIGLSWS